MTATETLQPGSVRPTVKGLGRHWSWEFLVKADADQMRLFSDAETPEIACGCYDG